MIPIPEYSTFIPASVVAAMLAYSALLWAFGRRTEAKNVALSSLGVALTIGLVSLGFTVGNYLVTEAFEYPPGVRSVVDCWGKLDYAYEVFSKAANCTVSWMLYLSGVRAALTMIPTIGPQLGELFWSMTSWQYVAFTTSGIAMIALAWFSRALELGKAWLLAFGAALAVSPRLRTLGGAMLAVILVTGPAVVGLANWVDNYALKDSALTRYREPPEPGSIAREMVDEFVGEVHTQGDKAANVAMHVTMLSVLVMSVSSLLAAGASRLLGSVPVCLRPV